MSRQSGSSAPLLVLLRYGLPALISLTGLIIMTFGSAVDLLGGAFILGAGPAVWFMNWYFRASVASGDDRDAEEAARVFLDEHGHWPDETRPPGRDVS